MKSDAPDLYYAGIGASQCAAIMGLDPNRTAYQLWREFRHPEERPDLSQNEQVEAGTMLEPAIIRWTAKRLGVEVETHGQDGKQFLMRHPKLPFMQCHPDALVRGQPAGMEVKNRGLFMMRQYVAVEDFDDDTDRVLPYEAIQCHHSIAVTGSTHWFLGVLIGGQKLMPFRIERDEAIIAKIEESCAAFWRCVETNTPPPPMNLYDVNTMFPEHATGKMIEATPELVQAVGEYRALKKQIKEADALVDFAALRIKSFMQDAEELRHEGKKLMTWKAHERDHFDLERFRADNPEMAVAYTTTKTVRALR